MVNKILEFLTELELAFPPPSGHHSITRYIICNTESRLALTLRMSDSSERVFFLEASDDLNWPHAIVRDIQAIVAAEPPIVRVDPL